jgi:hypothetical protein
MPDLDSMFGPKLVLTSDFEEPKPTCIRCGKTANYMLEKLVLWLKTDEGAHHVIQSTPNPAHIAICQKHKDDDLDEYIAGGCHVAIMSKTCVNSDMERYQVFWRELS